MTLSPWPIPLCSPSATAEPLTWTEASADAGSTVRENEFPGPGQHLRRACLPATPRPEIKTLDPPHSPGSLPTAVSPGRMQKARVPESIGSAFRFTRRGIWPLASSCTDPGTDGRSLAVASAAPSSPIKRMFRLASPRLSRVASCLCSQVPSKSFTIRWLCLTWAAMWFELAAQVKHRPATAALEELRDTELSAADVARARRLAKAWR